MKSEWKVFSVYNGGEKFYQIGRIRDTSRPVHAGNIEWHDQDIYTNKKTAKINAEELNMLDHGIQPDFGITEPTEWFSKQR